MSMRPWLVLKHVGAPFDEIPIQLYEAGSRQKILSHSPSGKVPALRHGDFWLAEPGGYVVRYVLAISNKDGEQRFEYNLARVNTSEEVTYPEGCSAVLTDFPVMDGARNLHRLPDAVDYTISTETSAISKFYQDKLVAQGWTFDPALGVLRVRHDAASGIVVLGGVPVAGVSPGALTFAGQALGTTSAPQIVTLSNTGTAPLTITQLGATPTPEFVSSSNCVGTIIPGARSCLMGQRM